MPFCGIVYFVITAKTVISVNLFMMQHKLLLSLGYCIRQFETIAPLLNESLMLATAFEKFYNFYIFLSGALSRNSRI